jgi:S-(hydroxymethyl)mycothiol dehydrogenase
VGIEARGVVVRHAGGPARIEPIEIDEPGPGEVLVRVLANGLCHSDLWAIDHGNWGSPFPMLLGHEGAGVVDAVGEGVEGLSVGDGVLLAWAVPCGDCPRCRRGRPRRCAHAWEQPPRLRGTGGERLVGTLSLGSLATHTVVHAAQAIPLPAGIDPVRACLLGCGVSTGVGAAVNTGGIGPGDTVAVVGLGGIGLAALQGARIAGASRLVAVDLVAAKFDAARALGATDTVDASAEDPVDAVRALTGGVDVALEATGNAAVVGQAVAMTAHGGTAVAIGVPAPDSTVTLEWGDATRGAAYPNKVTLKVTDGGDPLREDFDTWLRWALDGRLDLGAMVSAEVPFTDEAIAEASRAMLAGEVIRSVVRLDGPSSGARVPATA